MYDLQKIRLSQICLFVAVVVSALSCGTTSHRHLTEPLFMKSERINISHVGSMPGERSSAAATLSEQVTYSTPLDDNHSDSSSDANENRLDTNKVYHIPQVTVVSRARFAPVREGFVDIDFVIHVPKTFLSDNYQICLTPELLHNDSVVILDDVVLRGKDFIEKQESDYKRYERYASTIVDPSDYETAFVDHRAVNRELQRRRKDEISSYYSRWSLYQDYSRWKNDRQAEYDEYNVHQDLKLSEKLAAHDHKYGLVFSRMLASGRDTTALGKEYRKKRSRIIASSPVRRQITLATVPKEYRDFYFYDIDTSDIEPILPEKEDSVRIAGEHLMHERIAFNEVKDSRKEDVFKHMVVAPYRPDAHYSAVIAADRNFVYRYTHRYPVSAGLKNIRLTMKGNITAIDRSHYTIRRTDTLSFIISSMAELADGRLIANKDFTSQQRREYTLALQLLRNREYQRALKILNEYKDYNTALVLTCMGYNRQAYDLLEQLPPNGHTHYLSVILNCRLDDYNRAIDHLKKAYRMDASWSYRSEKDPEVSKLIRTYGLQRELEEIVYH